MAIHNIGIAERETVEYAMAQPTILRVDIKRKMTLVDRREVVYPLWYWVRLQRDAIVAERMGAN